VHNPHESQLFREKSRIIHKKAETESSDPIAFSHGFSDVEMLRKNHELRS